MNYSNKHRLPPEVVMALTKDRYYDETEEEFDYSATTIIAPIQQTVLKRRYPDKLKQYDVIDRFWSFLGSVSHSVLENAWHESMGGWVERRLYDEVLGKKISGKSDVYNGGQIRDYKSTKVYKIMKGDYSDWERQLNVLAHLCRKNGLEVTTLKIIALLFDWKKGETFKQGYPEAPIMVIPIRLWSEEEAEKYIKDRVQKLENAAQLNDQELMRYYPCSPEEQWSGVKDVSIMKKGSDRATKCFDTWDEAQAHYKEKGYGPEYEVTWRLLPKKRCMDHCDCSPVCLQWKEENK